MIASGCSGISTEVPLFSIVTGKLAALVGAALVGAALVGAALSGDEVFDWPHAVRNSALTATTTWIFLNIFLLVWSKKYPTQHTQGVIRRTLPREFLRKLRSQAT